jgi:hypothetical protein
VWKVKKRPENSLFLEEIIATRRIQQAVTAIKNIANRLFEFPPV